MQNVRNILILIHLLLASAVISAEPICRVRTFGAGNGLPASVVSGMTQSTDNLVWIATWNGLSCFDGYRFTTFRNIPGHDSQLTTNHLISVMPAMAGDLWVTTYSEDIYLFDSRRCQYVNVSALIEKKFHNKFSLRKIYPLANGSVWFVGKYNDHYRIARGGEVDESSLEQFNLPGTLNKVLLDKRGEEWMLCDQGAFCCEGKGKSRRVSPLWVDFVEEQNGQLWLITKDGCVISMKNNKAKASVYKNPLGVTKVNEVKCIGRNILALATDQGVLLYDTRTRTPRLVSVQWPGNPQKSVDAMFIDSRRRLWCFNGGNGMTMIDERFSPVYLMAKAGGGNFTDADKPLFHEDAHHTVWVASPNGCFSYYDESRKQLVPQSLMQGELGNGIIPRIRKGFSDHQGNLWLIYPHNLSLVSFAYSNILNIDLGVKRDTRSVLQDRDGNLLAGTTDGDIVKYSPEGKLLGYLSPDGKWQMQKTAFSFRIYAMHEDKKGRLWIGTKGNGLYCVDNGHVAHFAHDESNAYTMNSDEIYDVKEDTQGRLLLAAFEGGLNISAGSIYKGGLDEMKFLHCKNMLKGYVGDVFNKVRRIEVLPGGVVALSTTQGLLTYSDRYTYPDRIRFYVSRHTKNENSLYSSEVMQTQVAPDGKMYVVTLGGGLQCTDAKNLLHDNLTFRSVDGNEGNVGMLPSSFGTMQSMTCDNAGNLWVIGESRIACIGKNGLKEYGADEIGGVNISEALPSHSSRTDRIVVATEGGAISFLPKQMDRSSYAPNVVFTSIRYMDRDQEQPILNTEKLRVDVDHRSFSIFFSALDYSSHSAVSSLSENCGIRYAYKIDDGEWIYVHQGSNNASFNNFPAGNHTVSVKSTNGDGVWMNNERQLRIYAEPTFLESWWGRTVIWLIIAALAYFGLKKYMEKRAAEITEEATEKADAGKVRYMLRKPEIVDEDKLFMDKLLAYIEEHIDDVNLKVDDMAVAQSMGRSTFYARLKQIADMSPNDFLRHVRMKRAEDLVRESTMTFSQIAYSVGFSDPKYFGKCFKKHTGFSPSEYRKKHAAEAPDGERQHEENGQEEDLS